MIDSQSAEPVRCKTEKLAKKHDRAYVSFTTFTKMLDKACLDEEHKQWVEARLYEAVWMFTKSQQFRMLHITMRFITIFSSLAIPVVAGVATAQPERWPRVATLVIGLIGATALAIDQLMRYGPRWRLNRSGYEDFTSEGFAYFNRTDKYAKLNGGDACFNEFYQHVEHHFASYAQRYIVEIASLDDSGSPKTP